MHDFQESLKWGEAASDAPFWSAVYEKAFPNLSSQMRNRGDNIAQRRGVDRILFLNNGNTLYVDEKKRKIDYNDILLEFISVDKTGAPGWIEKDLAIDYLAYAFMPSCRCYLFDWPLLFRAWKNYGKSWKKQHKIITAHNYEYDTISVAVPIPIVMKAVSVASVIDVKKEMESLAE